MNKELMLNPFFKKCLKLVHILSIAGTLGSLLAILALLLIKLNPGTGTDVFTLDYTILKIFMNVVTVCSFVLIGTSLIYELFTEWGILKYHWILMKWLIVMMLFAVTWVGLGPSLSGMTSLSDAGFNSTTMKNEYALFEQKALVFVCIELFLMLAAGALSIFKPWGKRQEKRRINKGKLVLWLIPILLVTLSMPIAQSINLNKIRQTTISDTQLSGLDNGTYYGEANVGNYVYKVRVEVADHKIVKIESIDPRKSPYATYAEGVFSKIIRDQNANTDAITGATTTSKAYMQAVENALSGKKPSGGD
ncbi:MAG: FMN-binding protein [Clostridia bacterium]|nr:FMN-binding protein [Clostridia bacterium]